MVAKQINEKVSLIKKIVSHLSFLKNHGFSLTNESIEYDEEYGDSYNFIFSIPDTNRSLEISFTPKNKYLEDSFFVFIKNKNKNISIEDFLKNSGITNNKECFELNFYKGTFENKVRAFFNFLEKTFYSNWKEILLGNKWPDVPVDFGDYK